jgi:hypothetical protein
LAGVSQLGVAIDPERKLKIYRELGGNKEEYEHQVSEIALHGTFYLRWRESPK